MALLLLVPLLLLSIATVYYSLHYGITPMPTSAKAKKALLELLPNELEGPILELGAGFGTLTLSLCKKYSNPVIAYEISPFPYFALKTLKYLLNLKNLEVKRLDFFKSTFIEASLCVCYLSPKIMERLEKKFRKELKREAYVISNTFQLPGITAYQELSVRDLYRSTIFLYRMPF